MRIFKNILFFMMFFFVVLEVIIPQSQVSDTLSPNAPVSEQVSWWKIKHRGDLNQMVAENKKKYPDLDVELVYELILEEIAKRGVSLVDVNKENLEEMFNAVVSVLSPPLEKGSLSSIVDKFLKNFVSPQAWQKLRNQPQVIRVVINMMFRLADLEEPKEPKENAPDAWANFENMQNAIINSARNSISAIYRQQKGGKRIAYHPAVPGGEVTPSPVEKQPGAGQAAGRGIIPGKLVMSEVSKKGPRPPRRTEVSLVTTGATAGPSLPWLRGETSEEVEETGGGQSQGQQQQRQLPQAFLKQGSLAPKVPQVQPPAKGQGGFNLPLADFLNALKALKNIGKKKSEDEFGEEERKDVIKELEELKNNLEKLKRELIANVGDISRLCQEKCKLNGQCEGRLEGLPEGTQGECKELFANYKKFTDLITQIDGLLNKGEVTLDGVRKTCEPTGVTTGLVKFITRLKTETGSMAQSDRDKRDCYVNLGREIFKRVEGTSASLSHNIDNIIKWLTADESSLSSYLAEWMAQTLLGTCEGKGGKTWVDIIKDQIEVIKDVLGKIKTEAEKPENRWSSAFGTQKLAVGKGVLEEVFGRIGFDMNQPCEKVIFCCKYFACSCRPATQAQEGSENYQPCTSEQKRADKIVAQASGRITWERETLTVEAFVKDLSSYFGVKVGDDGSVDSGSLDSFVKSFMVFNCTGGENMSIKKILENMVRGELNCPAMYHQAYANPSGEDRYDVGNGLVYSVTECIYAWLERNWSKAFGYPEVKHSNYGEGEESKKKIDPLDHQNLLGDEAIGGDWQWVINYGKSNTKMDFLDKMNIAGQVSKEVEDARKSIREMTQTMITKKLKACKDKVGGLGAGPVVPEDVQKCVDDACKYIVKDIYGAAILVNLSNFDTKGLSQYYEVATDNLRKSIIKQVYRILVDSIIGLLPSEVGGNDSVINLMKILKEELVEDWSKNKNLNVRTGNVGEDIRKIKEELDNLANFICKPKDNFGYIEGILRSACENIPNILTNDEKKNIFGLEDDKVIKEKCLSYSRNLFEPRCRCVALGSSNDVDKLGLDPTNLQMVTKQGVKVIPTAAHYIQCIKGGNFDGEFPGCRDTLLEMGTISKLFGNENVQPEGDGRVLKQEIGREEEDIIGLQRVAWLLSLPQIWLRLKIAMAMGVLINAEKIVEGDTIEGKGDIEKAIGDTLIKDVTGCPSRGSGLKAILEKPDCVGSSQLVTNLGKLTNIQLLALLDYLYRKIRYDVDGKNFWNGDPNKLGEKWPDNSTLVSDANPNLSFLGFIKKIGVDNITGKLTDGNFGRNFSRFGYFGPVSKPNFEYLLFTNLFQTGADTDKQSLLAEGSMDFASNGRFKICDPAGDGTGTGSGQLQLWPYCVLYNFKRNMVNPKDTKNPEYGRATNDTLGNYLFETTDATTGKFKLRDKFAVLVNDTTKKDMEDAINALKSKFPILPESFEEVFNSQYKKAGDSTTFFGGASGLVANLLSAIGYKGDASNLSQGIQSILSYQRCVPAEGSTPSLKPLLDNKRYYCEPDLSKYDPSKGDVSKCDGSWWQVKDRIMGSSGQSIKVGEKGEKEIKCQVAQDAKVTPADTWFLAEFLTPIKKDQDASKDFLTNACKSATDMQADACAPNGSSLCSICVRKCAERELDESGNPKPDAMVKNRLEQEMCLESFAQRRWLVDIAKGMLEIEKSAAVVNDLKNAGLTDIVYIAGYLAAHALDKSGTQSNMGVTGTGLKLGSGISDTSTAFGVVYKVAEKLGLKKTDEMEITDTTIKFKGTSIIVQADTEKDRQYPLVALIQKLGKEGLLNNVVNNRKDPTGYIGIDIITNVLKKVSDVFDIYRNALKKGSTTDNDFVNRILGNYPTTVGTKAKISEILKIENWDVRKSPILIGLKLYQAVEDFLLAKNDGTLGGATITGGGFGNDSLFFAEGTPVTRLFERLQNLTTTTGGSFNAFDKACFLAGGKVLSASASSIYEADNISDGNDCYSIIVYNVTSGGLFKSLKIDGNPISYAGFKKFFEDFVFNNNSGDAISIKRPETSFTDEKDLFNHQAKIPISKLYGDGVVIFSGGGVDNINNNLLQVLRIAWDVEKKTIALMPEGGAKDALGATLKGGQMVPGGETDPSTNFGQKAGIINVCEEEKGGIKLERFEASLCKVNMRANGTVDTRQDLACCVSDPSMTTPEGNCPPTYKMCSIEWKKYCTDSSYGFQIKKVVGGKVEGNALPHEYRLCDRYVKWNIDKVPIDVGLVEVCKDKPQDIGVINISTGTISIDPAGVDTFNSTEFVKGSLDQQKCTNIPAVGEGGYDRCTIPIIFKPINVNALGEKFSFVKVTSGPSGKQKGIVVKLKGTPQQPAKLSDIAVLLSPRKQPLTVINGQPSFITYKVECAAHPVTIGVDVTPQDFSIKYQCENISSGNECKMEVNFNGTSDTGPTPITIWVRVDGETGYLENNFDKITLQGKVPQQRVIKIIKK